MPYQSIQSLPIQPTITINPLLDFTRNTAYVAVKIPGESHLTPCGPPVILTSKREMFYWDEGYQGHQPSGLR